MKLLKFALLALLTTVLVTSCEKQEAVIQDTYDETAWLRNASPDLQTYILETAQKKQGGKSILLACMVQAYQYASGVECDSGNCEDQFLAEFEDSFNRCITGSNLELGSSVAKNPFGNAFAACVDYAHAETMRLVPDGSPSSDYGHTFALLLNQCLNFE